MNIVTCQYPPCSKPIQPKSGRGKPAKFCSPACKIAQHRASKKPSTPIQSSPILQKLALLTIKQKYVTPSNSTVQPHILPYMPTQNDANISAILKHGSNAALPFPDHNAIPICSIPGPIPTPIQPPEIVPTF